MAPRAAYYLSTPIYYVNDSPHIGHAYTSLACDVLARFMRLDGRDVLFLTGTDEHGQKVQKSAIAAGMEPQDFVDQVSERFRALGGVMGYSTTTSSAPPRSATRAPARSCGAASRPTATSTSTSTRAGTRCETRRSAPRRR